MQVVKQCSRPLFLRRVDNPDFRQALIGGQVTDATRQKGALQTGSDTFAVEGVGPESGDGEIGGLGEAKHTSVSIAEHTISARFSASLPGCGGTKIDARGLSQP